MRKTPFAALLAACLVLAPALVAQPPADPKTEDEKTLYALGLVISRNLQTLNLNATELEMVKAGLTDGVLNKAPKVQLEVYGPKLQGFAQGRSAAAAAVEKKKGEAYLAKAAAEPGAKKLPAGEIVKVIKPGTGASPKATDTVKVHYQGTLLDGTVFDSSIKRGQPAEFPLNGVIKCWTDAVQTMKVGGKSQIVCPSDTAYGDQGAPPNIKGGSTLVFEVELLDVKATPAAPAAPPQPKKK